MNATTDQPMVRFEGVTKRYGALTVLDDLDLDVARSERWRLSVRPVRKDDGAARAHDLGGGSTAASSISTVSH